MSNLVRLTTIGDDPIIINSELTQLIQACPDTGYTQIRFHDGRAVLVRDTVDDIWWMIDNNIQEGQQ